MKFALQLFTALIAVAGTGVCVYFLVTSETNFMDLNFAKYFGILCVISFVVFKVLTENDDNEVTNPLKDKRK